MITLQSVTLAIVTGIIPALFWLFFWLREDRLHPEPDRYIVLSFVLGMLAVPLVIPLEHMASRLFTNTTLILLAWSTIEEVMKFGAAYFGGLQRAAMDEPIDALIYMITAALGFAAVENVLFLIQPFSTGQFLLGFITSNIRFIGATLLHSVASAMIGIALAFSFYKRDIIKLEFLGVGLIGAIVLHVLFNVFVVSAEGAGIFIVFLFVWLAAISLILIFEKVKKIKS